MYNNILAQCYEKGGNENPIASFEGYVSSIERNNTVYFDGLLINYNGKEDFVRKQYVIDKKKFLTKQIKKGDYVKFNAKVYKYRERNGNIQIGIRAPEGVTIIQPGIISYIQDEMYAWNI